MTRAPATLLAARTLLLSHLADAPGPDDLDPAGVGIVGDPAHRGGYHCGSDRVVTNDYSVVESPRDRAGLTSDASALDVGEFGYGKHNLRSFSVWCVGECVKGAPDTLDIREIIYSPDGKVVKRWDRLGKRTTGDSSHLYHTHFSFFRDAIKAGRDQSPLFRRYLQSIGLIQGSTPMADATQNVQDLHDAYYDKDQGFALGKGEPINRYDLERHALWAILNGTGSGAFLVQALSRIEAQLAAIRGTDFTNEPEIAAAVLRGLTPEMFAQAFVLSGWTPEAFAAALPRDLADQMIVALGRELSQ